MSDVPHQKPLRQRIWLGICDYWINVGLTVIPVIMSATAFLVSDEVVKLIAPNDEQNQTDIQEWAGVSFGGLVLFYFFVLWRYYLRQKRISGLIEEIDDLKNRLADAESAFEDYRSSRVQDVRTMSNGYLYDLAQRLQFGVHDTNSERATLYIHHSDDKTFMPIGRFSYNPKFGDKGRTTYPDNQGCIAEAWWHSSFFCNDLPDPDLSKEKYLDDCKQKYGLPKRVVEKFKMKSRLYFGWRILDRNKNRPLAVLVIESTDPNRWTKEELEETFKYQQGRYLSDLLEAMQPQLPDIAMARERGM